MGRGEQLRHRPDYRTAAEEIAESVPQEDVVIDSSVFLQHLRESNEVQEREHQELTDYKGYSPKIPDHPIQDTHTPISKKGRHS